MDATPGMDAENDVMMGMDTGGEAAVDAGPCATTGLISWWKADNTGNDEQKVFDLSSHFGASFSNMGYKNQAFVVDGTNYFEASPNTGGTFSTLYSVTIEGWIKPSDLTIGTILARKSYGGMGIDFRLFSGHIEFTFNGSTVTGMKTLAVDNWYHVAVTFDQNMTKGLLYVNGVQDTGGPMSGKISSENQPVRVGCRLGMANTTENCFKGLIDELAIYSTALSPGDITQIYGGMYQKCH
jgi:hypothetical protein